MTGAVEDAELAIIGASLLIGRLPLVCIDRGLKPEHFGTSRYGVVFSKVLELYDQGEPVDAVTLKAQGCDPALVDIAASAVPMIGHLPAYVELVIEEAMWRSRKRAGLTILDAAEAKDDDLFATAERALAAPLRAIQLWDKARLQDELLALLEAGETETFPWPFARLNQLVPMRRGHVTIIGGWTSHGKTTFVDQCARTLNNNGQRVIAWINEMTPIERAQRNVAAVSRIDLSRILRGTLRPDEYGAYGDGLKHIPFDIVDATGWSMEEISRDMRQRRPDVAILDILHLIPYRDERDLARISQILNATSKQAECHVLATAHLNEKLVVGTARPQPTLGAVKGASSLKQDADNVLFVWREDDVDTGLPTNVGQVYFAKARQGQVGGVSVLFDGERSEFSLDH
jgi:replicative DNA helicase